LTSAEIAAAQNYLFEPGIGITRDARAAIEAGRVTAMHDPTEGGIVTALWELAQASGKTLRVDPHAIPVPALARRVCEAFGIDPLCALASGSLLLTAPPSDAPAICRALANEGIACADIGVIADGPSVVERKTPTGYEAWLPPAADDITKAYA
jgi:hydrogenase maturation factor